MNKQNEINLLVQLETHINETAGKMNEFDLRKIIMNTDSTVNEFNKNKMEEYLEGKPKEELLEILISNLKKTPTNHSLTYFNFYLTNKNKSELSDDLNELFENVLNHFNLLESNKDKESIANLITSEEFEGEVREFLLQECDDMDDEEFEEIFANIHLHVLCSALYDEYLPLDGFELQKIKG